MKKNSKEKIIQIKINLLIAGQYILREKFANGSFGDIHYGGLFPYHSLLKNFLS